MDYYSVVIIVTFVAFSALAAALLIPVARFLKREEADGDAFTKAVKEAEVAKEAKAEYETSRERPANHPDPGPD